MKTLLIWSFFLICSAGFGLASDQEVKGIEASQVALWEQKLIDSKDLADHEKFESLWLGLRNMGSRRSTAHSENVDLVFLKLQSELLAIPGHAQYFVDELEKLRLAGKYTGRERQYYILETLPHLPSPETVQVLGRYLSDERDTPPPPIPGQDWTALPANCFLAVDALGRIGLRNPPVTKSFLYRDQAILDANRSWWREIQSGKRTFSFKGQDIEYRFNPDGTWDTITIANPPDDPPGTKESALKERPPVKRPQEDPMQKDETQHMNPWLWISGLIVVLLGLFALIGRRFKKH